MARKICKRCGLPIVNHIDDDTCDPCFDIELELAAVKFERQNASVLDGTGLMVQPGSTSGTGSMHNASGSFLNPLDDLDNLYQKGYIDLSDYI